MCCTDGTKGADTILYNAALQVTRSMGYKQLITYTLVTETPRVPGEDEKGEPQITARVSPEERSSLNSILKFPDHQKERLSDIDNLRMWLKRAKAIFEKLGHHDWVEDITDALDRLNRDDFGFVESLWIKFARDVDDLILIAPSLHDPPLTETQADELNGELAEVANQTFAAIDRVRDATSSLISSLV